MANLGITFSHHFTARFRVEDWSSDLVGLKALGLVTLPKEWTPPFLVIPAPVMGQTKNGERALEAVLRDDALEALLSRSPSRLIIRSSATTENIENRGWL